MQYFDLALGSARSAQERVQSLLAEAVEAQAYLDVGKIAALAERLAIALAPEGEVSPATAGPKRVGRDAAVTRPSGDRARTSKSARAERLPSPRRRPGRGAETGSPPKDGKGLEAVPKGYPRFEREADRLIKVGWSSRDQRGYEHRAMKSVVFSFVDRLRSHSGSPFAMDDVLPIKDESGSELPSYQAYLVIGWLRSVGAVRKIGKDGYSIDPVLASPEALERLWHLVPTR